MEVPERKNGCNYFFLRDQMFIYICILSQRLDIMSFMGKIISDDDLDSHISIEKDNGSKKAEEILLLEPELANNQVYENGSEMNRQKDPQDDETEPNLEDIETNKYTETTTRIRQHQSGEKDGNQDADTEINVPENTENQNNNGQQDEITQQDDAEIDVETDTLRAEDGDKIKPAEVPVAASESTTTVVPEAAETQNTVTNDPQPETLIDINTEEETQNENAVDVDTSNEPTSTNGSNEPLLSRPKRQLRSMEELQIIDPGSYRVEKIKKKIPGKLMDNFWQPLDSVTLNSFTKALHLSLVKTMERYTQQSKIVESRRILTNTWINDNAYSFRARLASTKLPPTTSMTTKLNEINDILDLDVVLSRKKYLETCLLAELKQLNELEKHEQNLQLSYNLDLKYLQQLKLTTSKQEHKMMQAITDTRASLHIDELEHVDDNINLCPDKHSFDPQKDEQVLSLLTTLHQQLTSMEQTTDDLAELSDNLDVVNNILDML